ncbi:hypothetical protein Emag_004150 [Eimeria magna]
MLDQATKFGQSTWDEIKHVFRKPREACHTVLNLCCVILAALMLWKVLVLAAGSPSPVVVVLSGSMLPAFSRGDILFLLDQGPNTAVGDIVVFKVEGREIPIVHRVLSVHTNHQGESMLLTKGDNNSVDDRGLYASRLFPNYALGNLFSLNSHAIQFDCALSPASFAPSKALHIPQPGETRRALSSHAVST